MVLHRQGNQLQQLPHPFPLTQQTFVFWLREGIELYFGASPGERGCVSAHSLSPALSCPPGRLHRIGRGMVEERELRSEVCPACAVRQKGERGQADWISWTNARPECPLPPPLSSCRQHQGQGGVGCISPALFTYRD